MKAIHQVTQVTRRENPEEYEDNKLIQTTLWSKQTTTPLPPIIKKGQNLIAFNQLGKLIAMAKQIAMMPSILKRKQKNKNAMQFYWSLYQSVSQSISPTSHSSL
jgi:hypothetical protein